MKLEQVLARWAKNMPPAGGARPTASDQVSGRWTNDYGSVAELKVDGERVFGTYTSAVGGAEALSGPISGFVSGDVVAFSVLWPSHVRSITSWVGQVVEVNGAPELRTLWHMVADIPDAEEATGLWATVHSGADTFR